MTVSTTTNDESTIGTRCATERCHRLEARLAKSEA
jgi:hypothetical protein